MVLGCLVLLIGAAGCRSDLDFRAIDRRGNYERAVLDGDALAIEYGGRRRVVMSNSLMNHRGVAAGQMALLYLSVPLDPVHGWDFKNTRAFVVVSDVSAEFSGFLRPEPLDHKRSRTPDNLQGKYTGTLRESKTGELRILELDVKDAPVRKIESREELDKRGYSDEIRDHLFRLEFDELDREYWRAATEDVEAPTALAGEPEEK